MRKQLITLIVVLLSAVLSSSAALAAGETKNQTPFTRHAVTAPTAASGETKSELPFTRLVAARDLAIVGEQKNQTPFVATPDWFERYAAAHPYGRGLGSVEVAPVSSSDGSRWRVVLGGSIAAAIALAGLLAIGRARRHSRFATPVA